MFSDGSGAINDVQYNITSLLLIFNKSVVFQQQILFFHSNLDFYLNECTESWKINICCRKTTILLKTSNNDAMLLSASFIASGALADDYTKNPLSEGRISKNPQISLVIMKVFRSPLMLPWQGLKWYYQLATYWWRASVATNRQQILPPHCLISQFSFVVPIFFRYW